MTDKRRTVRALINKHSDKLLSAAAVGVLVATAFGGAAYGRMTEADRWRGYFVENCVVVQPKEQVGIEGAFTHGTLHVYPRPGRQLGVCQTPEFIQVLR